MANPAVPDRLTKDAYDAMTSAVTHAAAAPTAGELNTAAQRAAAHYRRTALSPAIVSGGLRLAEFALLVASGLALFAAYVGLSTHLVAHYPVAILLGSALSFLGLGAQPPTAELGAMASEGRNFLFFAPHISVVPSVLIFLVVLAFNVLGDALRDALDPRSTK